ncbi:MAG: hypothetical protein Q7J44_15515 [Pseudotabrizicola sp.]|uniref:hypothetical protein n=1 Tax=Pseudotabrizicola sp. TaxID=2939647 RepID=UPI00271CEABA|nr:hypothetical protein [Pseudotabrizicola sp.]MDO9639945.1 hypothetical protein [Pseudotabrizicola sp.]
MRRFFPLSAALVLASAPVAQAERVQVADCAPGGCMCYISTMTLQEIAATLPGQIPDNAGELTLVDEPGGFSWRSETPAQLDRMFGGPGSCPVYLAGPMVPEDGRWQITTGATDTSACPMLAGNTPPTNLSGETRQINWNGSFHPDKLMSEAAGMVRWSGVTGSGNWRGVVADHSLADSSGATGASVIWTLSLVSPTEVRGKSVFDYNISSTAGDAAANAVLAGLQCRTVTPFAARKVN